MYLEKFKDKYSEQYSCIEVKPCYSAFIVDNIGDILNIKPMIFDYSYALMSDYLVRSEINKHDYYPYIVRDIFNMFKNYRLYIWNKEGDDGFGLFLQIKGSNAEFMVEYPIALGAVMKRYVCIDPNTLETETSSSGFFTEYTNVAIAGIYKAEQDFGLRFKELEYFDGNCDINRFKTIMTYINGFGRYELIDGNIITYCSKCSEEVVEGLVDLSPEVIGKCKILNSEYVDVDGTGSTYLYVDKCITKDKYSKVLINCYAGPQAFREYSMHYSRMKWGPHFEHIMIFPDNHRLISVCGNPSSPTIIDKNVGVFNSQLIEGIVINLNGLD